MINEYNLDRYCSGDVTEIENYEEAIADNTQTWVCHHRRELTEDGKFQYSREDLKENGEYYDRPSEELIFLTESEHKKMHNKGISDASREKISKSLIGRQFTNEQLENMSKAQKGKKASDATRDKMSKARKGKRYPSKHHDITVSVVDDRNAYARALYHKNKDEHREKARERYHKKKALAAK